MHKSDIFFWLILAFLGGTAVASLMEVGAVATLVLILIGVVIISVAGYHKTFGETKKGERKRKIGLVIGCAVLVATGAIIRYNSFAYEHSVLQTFAQAQAGGKGITVSLNGYVDAEETTSASGNGQIIFKVKSLTAGDQAIAVDERVFVSAKTDALYTVGQKLTLTGALQIPQDFNGFAYVQYLKNKDIRTTMLYPKISDDPSLAFSWGDEIKIELYSKIFAIKNGFESAVNYSLPIPYGAYINGVLLGSRTDIPADITTAFNKTSTTHILAISGYNITIIAWALLWLLTHLMPRRRAFWISVATIVLFTLMTGAGASVARAMIMGILLLFANGYGRLYDPRNSILLAGGIMVFLNPFVLGFDIGFQLSFMAVVGLIYAYPLLKERIKHWPELGGIKDALLMTASAQLLVFPLLIYYFNQFSLVSLPANILVLPFMPYVMLFGFATGALGMIAIPLGRVIGIAPWALSAYQLTVIKWFASWPFSSLNINVYWLTLCAIYALIFYIIWRMSTSSVSVVKE